MKKSVGMVALIISISSGATAQFKNVKIDESSYQERLTNPAIAISRRDSRYVVVSGLSDMMYVTSDGGLSWQKSKLMSPNMVSEDRILLSDGKGTFHAIQSIGALSPVQLFYSESRDNGITWDEPTAVSPNSGKDQVLPGATMDTKSNLFVSWTQLDKLKQEDSTCSSFIYGSVYSGKKWSKAIQLSQSPGNCKVDNNTAAGSVPAVGPDGKMFVSWYNKGKIYMDRSFGSSMWLQNDILIGNQTPGWRLNVEGHTHTSGLPVIMVDQSKGDYHGCLYLIWGDQRNGETDGDVWFMRSNNYGDNWSSPIRMGVTTLSKQQYAPRLAVDQTNGFIYILYFDRGAYDDDQTDVFLSYSSDSGANFKSVKISETSFKPSDKSQMGMFLNISAHNGVIVPVWSRMDEGVTSIWTTTIRQDELIKTPEVVKGKKKK